MENKKYVIHGHQQDKIFVDIDDWSKISKKVVHRQKNKKHKMKLMKNILNF